MIDVDIVCKFVLVVAYFVWTSLYVLFGGIVCCCYSDNRVPGTNNEVRVAATFNACAIQHLLRLSPRNAPATPVLSHLRSLLHSGGSMLSQLLTYIADPSYVVLKSAATLFSALSLSRFGQCSSAVTGTVSCKSCTFSHSLNFQAMPQNQTVSSVLMRSHLDSVLF